VERNTVIALALIILIWLLWPKWVQYTSPETEPVVPTPAQVDSSGAKTHRTTRDSAAARTPAAIAQAPVATDSAHRAAAPVALTDTIPVQELTITTPKYVAVLSNEGATLRQWRLKTYHMPDGSPVQLLPEGGKGLGLLVGAEGKETDLRNRVFTPDSLSKSVTLGDKDSAAIGFTCTLENGRRVFKRYVFHGNSYHVDFSAGLADSLAAERLTVSWDGAVPSTEGDFVSEASNMYVEAYVGGSLEKLQTLDNTEVSTFTGQTDWVGVRNKYFLAAFAPSTAERWDIKLSGRGTKEQSLHYGYRIAPFDASKSRLSGSVYMGPLDVDVLSIEGHNLEQAADLGWSILRPISKLILWFFLNAYTYIPNYGWIIVIFSVLVKILLHPLTKKSYESTSKMQKVKPLMDEIREKYKSDQQRMNQEMIKLYKEHGFNPLGGCLPMILQMPIIFAIYAVIGNNIEFRQAHFIWWITDLSIPDTVYKLPFHIPLYGSHVTILPVLMAISMFFQQKLTITDPKQQMLVYMMPVIMLFVFNNLASGLVLYWFLFNVFSSAHQYWLTKQQNGDDVILKPAMATTKNVAKPRKR
jgi:YidC/Oxa1 family membrane protein insertase